MLAVAWRRFYVSTPEGLSSLRRHCRRSMELQWLLLNPVLDAAELVISELATNAIRHADGVEGIDLRIVDVYYDHPVLTIECRDGSPVFDVVAPGNSLSDSCRGLGIVTALTDHWHIEPRGSGKSVIAVIDTSLKRVKL